ncbi:MAG: hypothetical protein KA313_09175 [Pseudarcicella sp.]|nr:hypothetical protein [Pseudarcicella sp.]
MNFSLKKYLLAFGIFTILVSGYIFFTKRQQNNLFCKDLIPDSSILLIEEKNHFAPKNLSSIFCNPILSKTFEQIVLLSKTAIPKETIKLFLKDKKVYHSLMMLSKNDVACVSYVQYQENEDFIQELSKLENKENGIKSFKRATMGVTITDILDNNLKPIFSFIKIDNILIFSETSLLIEDIILNKTNNSWANSIVLENNSNSEYSVFFNHNAALTTANDVFQNSINNQSILDLLLPESTSLADEENSGKLDTKSNANFVELFEGQTNNPIECFDKIPVQCNYFLHFSFSDFEKIAPKIQNKKSIKEHKKLLEILENESFYQNIGNEIALIGLGSLDDNTVKSILLVKNNKDKKISQLLNKTRFESNNLANEIEKFGDFSIKKINYNQFLNITFGDIFHSFHNTYITDIQGYSVFSNDLECLHKYLISVSNKDVWSNHSGKIEQIKNLKSANLTYIFQGNHGWSNMINLLKPDWQNKTDQALSVTKNTTWIYQNGVENNINKGYILPVLPSGERQKSTNNFNQTKLFIAKDTISGRQIICDDMKIYQNKKNQLVLIKNDKTLSRVKLNDKLMSDLNFLSKNDSKNLIGFTSKSLVLIDINNKQLKCLEIKTSQSSRFKKFSLLDNSTSKTSIVNPFGEMIVVDKPSKTIKENKIAKNIINISSEQININGKKYTPIISKNGTLDLIINENIAFQNFPITLKGTFESPLVIDNKGDIFSLKALSSSGILYTISLTGKIQEQKQLTRQKTEDKFSILKSPNGNDWVINRQNDYTISIINPKEKEFCIINDLKEKYKKIAYYDLGNSTKILVVQVKNYYFFYTLNGSIIGIEGLKSDFQPTLQLDEKKRLLKVFTQSKNDLMEWSIKLSSNAI